MNKSHRIIALSTSSRPLGVGAGKGYSFQQEGLYSEVYSALCLSEWVSKGDRGDIVNIYGVGYTDNGIRKVDI